MQLKILPKLRILPVTVAAAGLLTAVKVVDVWQGSRILGAPSAIAEASKTAGRPASLIPADKTAPAPAPRQQLAADDRPAAKEAGAATATAPETQAGEAPAAAKSAPARDAASFSASEIDVLQNLSKRREALEQRAQELDAREALLAAAEKRIDKRIGELKAMEQKLTQLVKQKDEEEEKRLRGLVKVYENMKPSDAARIFQELDMPVLLDVVERMKEAKLAPILAVMTAQKAKEITIELAQRRSSVASEPAKPKSS